MPLQQKAISWLGNEALEEQGTASQYVSDSRCIFISISFLYFILHLLFCIESLKRSLAFMLYLCVLQMGFWLSVSIFVSPPPLILLHSFSNSVSH